MFSHSYEWGLQAVGMDKHVRSGCKHTGVQTSCLANGPSLGSLGSPWCLVYLVPPLRSSSWNWLQQGSWDLVQCAGSRIDGWYLWWSALHFGYHVWLWRTYRLKYLPQFLKYCLKFYFRYLSISVWVLACVYVSVEARDVGSLSLSWSREATVT